MTGEPKPTWECVPCGATFHAWAAVERHIDQAHGGGRVAFVLDDNHKDTP